MTRTTVLVWVVCFIGLASRTCTTESKSVSSTVGSAGDDSANASPTDTPESSGGDSGNASPTNTQGSTGSDSGNASPTNTQGSTGSDSANASPTNTQGSTGSDSGNASPTNTQGSTGSDSANASPTNTQGSTGSDSANPSPTNAPGPSRGASANPSPTNAPGPSRGASTNPATTPTSGSSLGNSTTSTTGLVPSTVLTTTATTMLITPPPSMPPHPEKAYFNLGFSLKIDANFSKDLKNKTSPNYVKYSAEFKNKITQAFLGVPGFTHVLIVRFRKGSIICDYKALIEATANPAEVIKNIKGQVTKSLKKVNVFGDQVDSDYLDQTLAKDLKTWTASMSSKCKAEGICETGYKCSDHKKNIECISNCNSTDCGDQGVCQLKADGKPICRCNKHPKYVYSGDNCEIKGEQLLLKSEYIAAIAGGGGGGLVFILVIALICTCVRKRKAKEKRDGPLNAFDEGTHQQWTSMVDDPRGYNNNSYEQVEMDQLPIKRKEPSAGEEPFSVYQPTNITRPMTRASAEFATLMDEGPISQIHALPIKSRADTSYASHHDHNGRYNRDEDARRDAGQVQAAAQAGILNGVRRHDRMREDHYMNDAGKSFDTNHLSSVVPGSNINEHRENITVKPNTPQMQIQNPKLDPREQYAYVSHDGRGQDSFPSRDHLRRDDSPSFHRQEQDVYSSSDHLRRDNSPSVHRQEQDVYSSPDHLRRNDSPSVHRQEQDVYPSRDHLRRDDFPSIHRQGQDVYPSRDHLRRDNSPSVHRQEQDVYPSRDHLRRDDSPSLHRREHDGIQSRDQRGQEGYVPMDRNLERLHREERTSDRNHGRHESFRNDRRSFREADHLQQAPVPSPKPRPKNFGELRHPNSFIAVPEPDYGVEHDRGIEHDRHRPSHDNESRDGRQLYRTDSPGRVNDSPFARDLQRRGQEIKRTEGQGARVRLRESRDSRGHWENSDRRSENWSRQGRDGNEGRHFNHF